jgi:NADPH-dependent glutamate synthase beta subunit-like oxidoreductase
MLRYGIPAYRLPREILDTEINAILANGVTVRLNDNPTRDGFTSMIEDYDATLLAIGCQNAGALGIDGEDAKGVMSAVEMLGVYGGPDKLDFTGEDVVVVGGGNVAVDVARTALRSGANKVTMAYRRRRADMTAQDAEIGSAVEEGVELLELAKPVRVEVDGNGHAAGLWVKPQMAGLVQRGRPSPVDNGEAEYMLEATRVLVAVGQQVDSGEFEEHNLTDKRGRFTCGSTTHFGDVGGLRGVFAGGDAATGPATAIRAIAAGKVAAANIDEYLGYNHEISVDVDIPDARLGTILASGRANMPERPSGVRAHDYDEVECPLNATEATAEASRCLRCDHFGFGAFREGREASW